MRQRKTKGSTLESIGLPYICRVKSAWLPSMCRAKSALLPSMCGAKYANLLGTPLASWQTCPWPLHEQSPRGSTPPPPHLTCCSETFCGLSSWEQSGPQLEGQASASRQAQLHQSQSQVEESSGQGFYQEYSKEFCKKHYREF